VAGEFWRIPMGEPYATSVTRGRNRYQTGEVPHMVIHSEQAFPVPGAIKDLSYARELARTASMRVAPAEALAV
jgi:hypothetical protein